MPHESMNRSTADGLDASWTPVVEQLRAATTGELVIGGELGHGGMAAVFLAYDTRLNRRVAVKVMSPALLMGDGLVRRFADEARTMANLRHPNIITIHSVRQAEAIHFFVMELVAGRALDRILQHTGALPVPVAQAILWQVGSALNYAHRRGVIHRDIKPANILIDEEGSALVTDFGIAKLAETPARTLTGILVGTPAYMSPEQCYGSNVDATSDQYSLGVVAYEMLTGCTPFSGTTFAVMQAHTLATVPPLRERRPDLPPELEEAVARMLEKDPARRWPTLRDALAALGARPLLDDDPVRAELARLATLGEAPAATTESLTPTGQRRIEVPTPVQAAVSAPHPDENRLFLIVAEPPARIVVGDTFEMSAVICREQGTIVVDRRVAWSSSDPGVVRVDERSGAVKALAPGRVTISASAYGMSDSATVDVVPRQPSPARGAERAERTERTEGTERTRVMARSRLAGGAALGAGLAAVALWALTGETLPRQSPLSQESSTGTPKPTREAQRIVATVHDTMPSNRQPAGEKAKDVSEPQLSPPGMRIVRTEAPRVTYHVATTVPESVTRAATAVSVVAPPTSSLVEPAPLTVDSATIAASASEDRPTETQAREAAMQCGTVLQTKDVTRLSGLSRGETGAQRRDQDAIVALMRDEGAKLVVAPLVMTPRLDDRGATTDITVRLTWRSAFGGQRTSVATFRSELAKVDGQWQLTSCRLTAGGVQ